MIFSIKELFVRRLHEDLIKFKLFLLIICEQNVITTCVCDLLSLIHLLIQFLKLFLN
jgi:hypothetical protein